MNKSKLLNFLKKEYHLPGKYEKFLKRIELFLEFSLLILLSIHILQESFPSPSHDFFTAVIAIIGITLATSSSISNKSKFQQVKEELNLGSIYFSLFLATLYIFGEIVSPLDINNFPQIYLVSFGLLLLLFSSLGFFFIYFAIKEYLKLTENLE
jgi:drug/metabolite transporter (DMT)-like permease